MTRERAVVWWQGLVAGLLGYAAVALFFGVVNVLGGDSFFHTAAVLGHGLLGTDRRVVEAAVEAGPVFAYNGVHLVLFLGFGFAAAWLVEEAERHPVFWYLVFFAFLVGFFYDVALLSLFTLPLGAGEISWVTIVAANLSAGVVMGAYLVRGHPGLRETLEAGEDPERAGRA